MAKRKLPDTSVDAYNSLDQSQLAEIYQNILFTLRAIQKGTFQDISGFMMVEDARVWKRLAELEKMGFIHRPGTKKKLRSGREGYEWALTLKGSPTIQEHSRQIQSIAAKVNQLKLL